MSEELTGTGSLAPIDWNELHRRLGRISLALDQKISVTTERKKEILKERAAILAHEKKSDPGKTTRLEIVEFILAYERYAIESSWVREVYPLKEITLLPGTPPFILGIINVRGRIVSIVDLKVFFDLPTHGLTDLNKVIIISDDSMEFGLLADAVPGVCQIPLEEIQAGPPTLTGIRAEYLRGVSTDHLVVLDAAKLLADPKLKICQSADA